MKQLVASVDRAHTDIIVHNKQKIPLRVQMAHTEMPSLVKLWMTAFYVSKFQHPNLQFNKRNSIATLRGKYKKRSRSVRICFKCTFQFYTSSCLFQTQVHWVNTVEHQVLESLKVIVIQDFIVCVEIRHPILLVGSARFEVVFNLLSC